MDPPESLNEPPVLLKTMPKIRNPRGSIDSSKDSCKISLEKFAVKAMRFGEVESL